MRSCSTCAAIALAPGATSLNAHVDLWHVLLEEHGGVWLAPSAHVGALAGLSAAHQGALWAAVEAAKRRADPSGRVAAWTVSIDEAPPVPAEAAHLRVRVYPAEAAGLSRLSDGLHGAPFGHRLRAVLQRATDFDVVVAFLRLSGLVALRPALRDALARGLRVRVITGDYLGITQPEALDELLDLGWSAGSAVDEGEDGEPTDIVLGMNVAEAAPADAEGETDGAPRPLELRVIETEVHGGRSFHPKAWMLQGPAGGVAWVGSSNWSREALFRGVEWNLRVDAARDPAAWAELRAAFAALWGRAVRVDPAWVQAYRARRVERADAEVAGLAADPSGADALAPLPPPNSVQVEALAALEAHRAGGGQAALVVLATGLGKTMLAVMELARIWRPGWRLLWVAHRRELLVQAGEALRRGLPGLRMALVAGGADPRALHRGGPELVLGSIQTVGRAGRLHPLPVDAFDVLVVDEVHHASAPSYRRLLSHLAPGYRIGLTATPERSDGGDILGLFDEQVVYRADLGVGVLRGLLVPFRYFGLRDTVDYGKLPWRNGRFDTEALCAAVETQARMHKLWEAWGAPDRAGRRTLVFCAAIRHADFVGGWLRDRGVRAAVCHGGLGADDREEALAALRAGDIDCIVSVDLFNEGLDCPPVDRVVMLRPTESAVMFLQQLGRGLRTHAEKHELVVIDFVGNHAVFLRRLDTLLSAAGASEGGVLERIEAVAREGLLLPTGCSVDLELEAVSLLERFVRKVVVRGPRPGAGLENEALRRVFHELWAAFGARPRAGELVRRGWSLARVHAAEGGWCGFLAAEGALTAGERGAHLRGAGALRWVEAAGPAERIALQLLGLVLDHREAGPIEPSQALALLAARGPERRPRGGRGDGGPGVGPASGTDAPEPTLEAELSAARASLERAGLLRRSEGLDAALTLAVAEDDELCALLVELVDARTAALWRAGAALVASRPVLLRVEDGPLGVLLRPEPGGPLPMPGSVDVRLPDGRPVRLIFDQSACREAQLGAARGGGVAPLLDALGLPPAGGGALRLSPSPDGWWVEAAPTVERVSTTPLESLPGFPTIQAAAGFVAAGAALPEIEPVYLPGPHPRGAFAVRVSGGSMDGGRRPLADGDWAILEPCRGLGLGAVEGEVALVGLGAEDEGQSYHLKRVQRGASGLVLRSDGGAVSDRDAADAALIARLRGQVRPEAIGPAPGAEVDDPCLALGLPAPLAPRTEGRRWARVGGHLLLLADGVDLLDAPDRWALPVPGRRPAETAYLFARGADADCWIGLGVARWMEGEGSWGFTAPSLGIWRTLCPGTRRASRTLPAGALDRAREFAAQAHAALEGRALPKGRGSSLVVVGRAKDGGLRVQLGATERGVSLTDIGWCLVAADEVERSGGVLDEARVNRVRYLEGTPKGSTRWIDTGCALAVLAGWKGIGEGGTAPLRGR